MHRDWMANPVFRDEPFTEREAWIWIIESAVFKPARHRIDGRLITLERGQFALTIRGTAAAWGWSKTRVLSYLQRLAHYQMITTKTGTRRRTSKTILTVCNYKIYQDPTLNIGTTDGTTTGQGADTAGTIKNEVN